MHWVCPFGVLRVEPLKTIQLRFRSGCCGGQGYNACHSVCIYDVCLDVRIICLIVQSLIRRVSLMLSCDYVVLLTPKAAVCVLEVFNSRMKACFKVQQHLCRIFSGI